MNKLRTALAALALVAFAAIGHSASKSPVTTGELSCCTGGSCCDGGSCCR